MSTSAWCCHHVGPPANRGARGLWLFPLHHCLQEGLTTEILGKPLSDMEIFL